VCPYGRAINTPRGTNLRKASAVLYRAPQRRHGELRAVQRVLFLRARGSGSGRGGAERSRVGAPQIWSPVGCRSYAACAPFPPFPLPPPLPPPCSLCPCCRRTPCTPPRRPLATAAAAPCWARPPCGGCAASEGGSVHSCVSPSACMGSCVAAAGPRGLVGAMQA
jgi:hypothetical protein